MPVRAYVERPPAFVLQYYAYRATAAVGFTAPVWYLYLEATTGSYALAATANAVWWTALVLLEVPTGYVGDRIGRRNALLAGTVVYVLASAAMAFVGSFLEVAAVFVFWAVGSTFRSGTTDAWLYEVLGRELDEGAFARVRGRGGTVAAASSGLTALAGGYIAADAMADAYLASAGVAALGLPILLSFPTVRGEGTDAESFTVLDALPVVRERFGRPPLRSFVLLVALYSGVHWGVNFFVQPVTVALGFSRAHLGWMFAAFTGLTGLVSYFSGAIQQRVGARGWFRTVPLVLGVAVVAAALVPVLAIPVFFLLRGLRGAAMPLATQYLNDRVEDVGRATLLSAAGMVYNLVTVPFELGAGWLADRLGLLPTVGLFGVVLVVGTLVLLAVGRPFAGGTAEPGQRDASTTAAD